MTLGDTITLQRLFIGFSIPERVRNICREALVQYKPFIKRNIPEDRWHMTLLFLGDCLDTQAYAAVLAQPLPQAYVPTITLTHIGKGLAGNQLWVSALPTVALEEMGQMVRTRIGEAGLRAPSLLQSRDFMPHIHVADLQPALKSLLVDKPLQVTFVPRELHLFRSETAPEHKRIYTSQARIPLLA
ncbi:MAG: hypothetical protein HYZ63_02075 [Candidatus Andersenbacteria bacterium]|nr:hypothetical protein [Candidatus Andersenbacteria bacterium]